MIGNFKYSNPTKLYFGDDSLKFLADELKNQGSTVMLSYGGGSIKRNGIYDQVVEVLKQQGKKIVEDGGVMSNPTVEKLNEGVKLVRENNVDFILAVGGGSTIDYAKGVGAAANYDGDAWDWFYLKQNNPLPGQKLIPVGAVLTMVGTGSEMNGGSVITNHAQGLKIGKVFGEEMMPKFAILNPKFTFSVPRYQMVSGIFDIMSHIMEQYFSGADDNTSDYLAEGLMRSLVKSSLDAVENPENYEARSNIMWTATWALNTLIGCGKTQDWEVHMIGQAIGAVTNATHGMTLAAVSGPYYRFILDSGVAKFRRFAENVWSLDTSKMSDHDAGLAGIAVLEDWMNKIGVVTNSKELGVTEENIPSIAKATIILDGGYRVLTKDDVVTILRESMK